MNNQVRALGGAVATVLGVIIAQPAQSHPSFANGGTTFLKCGLETMFIDRLSTDPNPGTRTNLLNQDGLSPGTSTSGNAKAVDPAGTSYNGSLQALVGATNPVLKANGANCGPGANAFIDGIKIGHGTFQVEKEKYNITNGDKRAFLPSQVDPATQLATTVRYYGRLIASDNLFPTGADADGSGNPDCAPASLSSNGTGENLNPGGWPGATAAASKWFTPNSLWTANGGVPLCRPAVAQVLSYTADGQDLAPAVPTGFSGVTSTTAAVNVNDGWSPTADYTLGKFKFTRGNFGRPTSLSKEMVYSTTGTVNGKGSYNIAMEAAEGGSYTAGAPVKTLLGTFRWIGNPAFSQNIFETQRDGWHGRKAIVNKNPKLYPIDPYLSAGLAESPGVPAYEISPFVDYSSASQAYLTYNTFEVVKPGRFTFAPTSCARNIVVRPAVADRSAKKDTLDKLDLYPTEERINTFFGGRTNKYHVGDAGHQNWWMHFVLLHRDDNDPSWDKTLCPIAKRYDVVVLPSIADIDQYLPGPNFKETAPCSTDPYCGTPIN